MGESHVPRIAHTHLPHLPTAWWCKESYFSTKKEVKDGSLDGRSAGNQLRAGMAMSLGLLRAGREQGKDGQEAGVQSHQENLLHRTMSPCNTFCYSSLEKKHLQRLSDQYDSSGHLSGQPALGQLYRYRHT